MKNLIFTLLLFAAMHDSVLATDRLVVQGGAGGAYANIIDAMNAAVSGDRILITPKAGGATWNENITMTAGPNNAKSLQFLSATQGAYWKLNGSISITPAAVGQYLTVMGCQIIAGNITSGASAPTGARCKVTVMGCKMDNGFINFDNNYYDLNIAGDSLMNGYVYLRYGKVMGNFIDAGALCAHGVHIGADAVATNDVLHIVGNKIDASSNACTNYGIRWLSTSHFYNISNNYVKQNATSQNAIYVDGSKTSTAAKNKMMNNTTVLINNGNLGIYVASFGSYHQVFGNVVYNIAGTGGYGLGASSNSILFEASYNYVTTANATNGFYQFTNDGTNVNNIVFTYDASTGEVLTGLPINGGHPDLQFNDINLTRNDAGCFGGSWSRENFLGGNMTSTQVTFFDAPTRILTGNTININGEGFDK
ncbi:MAG: hypothetical protein SH856_04620 [Flavobacteriales bacterium]|nr:hypothetical protein [Flavobacteriales bacterium]